MSGLSPGYFKFFKGLEKENSKVYFDAHRSEYEQHVKEPFKELVQTVIERMRKYEPTLSVDAKDAIFRINRDVRFAKDKAPYKTFCAAHISAHGKKAVGRPGFYFQIGAAGGFIGGGAYMPEKDELAAIRSLLVKKGKDFEKVIKSKKFTEHFGELRGDRNKVVPAEFREAAEKNPLIANKQFFWGADLSKTDVQSDKLVSNLIDYYLAQKPAQDFFNQLY